MTIQTYEEALNWIHGRLRLGMKPGLKRMEWMMEKLNHPERRLKVVHIGGTNGKGSTLTYLRNILQAAEYDVGTFTSPYIERFNERISVNGQPINDVDLIKLTNVIKPLSEELEQTELGGPTEFEIITAMAFYYFAYIRPVDLLLVEVGLGGRHDSTNVIHPILSIITSIGLDHTSILGNTYKEIAKEKSGIIKNGVGVITAVKQEEAIQVIREVANDRKAPLYELGKQFHIDNYEQQLVGESYTFRSIFQSFDRLYISMIGKHQVENASLATMAAIYLKNFFSIIIEEEHIRKGLERSFWPVRFEIIQKEPTVILDGAHNEEGIQTLVTELEKRYSDKRIKVIFAALDDKKFDRMIHLLDDIADEITFVEFDFPRAAKAENLYAVSTIERKAFENDWTRAVETSMKDLEHDEILVITGSLYFLSDVRKFIKKSTVMMN